jgi:hypothetical protein
MASRQLTPLPFGEMAVDLAAVAEPARRRRTYNDGRHVISIQKGFAKVYTDNQ